MTAEVSRQHLTILAVLKKFKVDLQEGIKVSSYFNEEQHTEISKLEFFDSEFKQFDASDNETGFMLNKISKVVQNK